MSENHETKTASFPPGEKQTQDGFPAVPVTFIHGCPVCGYEYPNGQYHGGICSSSCAREFYD